MNQFVACFQALVLLSVASGRPKSFAVCGVCVWLWRCSGAGCVCGCGGVVVRGVVWRCRGAACGVEV